jgi:hypothetical protein
VIRQKRKKPYSSLRTTIFTLAVTSR